MTVQTRKYSLSYMAVRTEMGQPSLDSGNVLEWEVPPKDMHQACPIPSLSPKSCAFQPFPPLVFRILVLQRELDLESHVFCLTQELSCSKNSFPSFENEVGELDVLFPLAKINGTHKKAGLIRWATPYCPECCQCSWALRSSLRSLSIKDKVGAASVLSEGPSGH